MTFVTKEYSLKPFRTFEFNNFFDRLHRQMNSTLGTDITFLRKIASEFSATIPKTPVSNFRYLNDGTAVYEMAATGFSKDDIKIEVEDDTITIKGTRKAPEEEIGTYVYQRVNFEDIDTEIVCSHRQDLDNIKVSLQDGLLTLRVPLKEEAKPRKIEIPIK